VSKDPGGLFIEGFTALLARDFTVARKLPSATLLVDRKPQSTEQPPAQRPTTYSLAARPSGGYAPGGHAPPRAASPRRPTLPLEQVPSASCRNCGKGCKPMECVFYPDCGWWRRFGSCGLEGTCKKKISHTPEKWTEKEVRKRPFRLPASGESAPKS
jgi:hypothetical protein